MTGIGGKSGATVFTNDRETSLIYTILVAPKNATVPIVTQ